MAITTFDLPAEAHKYGKACPGDSHDVRALTSSWNGHLRSHPRMQSIDYKKLNKQMIAMGSFTSPQAQDLRSSYRDNTRYAKSRVGVAQQLRNKLNYIGNNPSTMMDWDTRQELRAGGVKNPDNTPIVGVVNCNVLNTVEHMKKEQEAEDLRYRNLALNMHKTLKKAKPTKNSTLLHKSGQSKLEKLRP